MIVMNLAEPSEKADHLPRSIAGNLKASRTSAALKVRAAIKDIVAEVEVATEKKWDTRTESANEIGEKVRNTNIRNIGNIGEMRRKEGQGMWQSILLIVINLERTLIQV
jgi:hypothetical protein